MYIYNLNLFCKLSLINNSEFSLDHSEVLKKNKTKKLKYTVKVIFLKTFPTFLKKSNSCFKQC